MPISIARSRVAVGGVLAAAVLVAGGVAVWARTGHRDTTDTAAAVSASEVASDTPAATPAPEAPPVDPATTLAPATTVTTPKATTPTTTAGRAVPKVTTPTTTAPAKAGSAPPTTTAAAAPVTPQFTPGQRINPTSAQVQAAITALHQRIPLFDPTESQLRTFADATCTQFDQGQTLSQVQSTVQQAVTYVQGASLSAADAAFAVKTVVQLRCPGYPA